MDGRSGYILNTNEKERKRLQLQADVLRPFTLRTLLAAGLRRGMKVLDVGTGIGDVALLAAELVGNDGHVYGVDIDEKMLAMASQQAVDFERLNVSFHHVDSNVGSIRGQEPCLPAQYDLVVARFVVAQQPSPLAFLQTLYQYVGPGGVILIFETANAGRTSWSFPHIELYDSSVRLLMDVTGVLGHNHEVGTGLIRMFTDAGIPQPHIAADLLVGGPDSEVLKYMLLNMTVIFPQAQRLVQHLPSTEDLEQTLLAIESSVRRESATIFGQAVVGVWSQNTEV